MNKHIEIDIENRKIFKKKKLIRRVYYDYFNEIKKNINPNLNHQILEIGSSGFIKDIIPDCITSNLVKNDPLIDRKINIFDLQNEKEIFSNIILIDIFHHLQFPMLALKNLNNSLCEKGRVILIEPAMGILPRAVYKIFHHEPNGFDLNIDWSDNPKQDINKNSYFAAQALTWRAFVKKEMNYSEYFNIKKISYFSDFAYLGSGGFSFKSMYPEILYPFIKKIDYLLNFVSRKFFAARMLIVLEKK